VRLPTYFIPHGAGPCFFMEWTRGPADTWDRTAAWLKGLVARLPARPEAILMVSGHWDAPSFTVGSADRPQLIFDYYGFRSRPMSCSSTPPARRSWRGASGSC
jgi:aromatic ring-opening dioxygenase catalytic subunit (LigB family)